jgi:hypothetical protein
MPMRSLLLTFAVAVAVGLAADWIGAPPAWIRRVLGAAAAGPPTAAASPARRGGAWRRKVAAAAGAATVAIGGGVAVRLLLSMLVLELGLARLNGVETGLAVASALAMGAAFWAWWMSAFGGRQAGGRAR